MTDGRIDIHIVEEGDNDYPHIAMCLVENKEKYTIMKLTVDGKEIYIVPLFQVLDGISKVHSDYTIRNGKKYCSYCWSEVPMTEIEKGAEE